MMVEDAVLYFGEVNRLEKEIWDDSIFGRDAYAFRPTAWMSKGRVVVTRSDQMVVIRLDGEGKNKHGPLVDWTGDERKS